MEERNIVFTGGIPITTTGVGGDPWMGSILGGEMFWFHGKHNGVYRLIDGKMVDAVMRVASVPVAPEKTYVDAIKVKSPKHCVEMTLDGCRLDGKPLKMSDSMKASEELGVWHRVGHGGEIRVDLEVNDWRIAILYDDGTDLLLHGGGELENVPHLALFVDDVPRGKDGKPDMEGVKGLLVEGKEGSDPKDFEVKCDSWKLPFGLYQWDKEGKLIE